MKARPDIRISPLAILAPLAVAAIILLAWELAVRSGAVSRFILPTPSSVVLALWTRGAMLLPALGYTLQVALTALAIAFALGLGIGIAMVQSRIVERSLMPYAIALQVTPLIAIAPLIVIAMRDNIFWALVVCAVVVAFFPILANTLFGLKGVDAGLKDLFRLYRAGRWQTLWLLLLPAAMPSVLGGLRIAGGLSLIGAVAAEFVAGTQGGEGGIAYDMLQAGMFVDIPRLYAGLVLLVVAGLVLHGALGLVARVAVGRWYRGATT